MINYKGWKNAEGIDPVKRSILSLNIFAVFMLSYSIMLFASINMSK